VPDLALSVVICTYNRASVLKGTLESFSKLAEAHDERIELIIVDNNSNDATAQISEDAKAAIPYLRYVHESRQGLSNARNRGIRESRGAIVAFADDDVYFDSAWAYAIINAFSENPSADSLGGRSTPIFEGGRPEWMQDKYLVFYGDTGFGDNPKWLCFPEHPFGLNMAFRRQLFERVGHFNPNLGRIKKSLLSGEESDLFERIYVNGRKTFYSPKPHLFHRIPKERVSLDWLKSRFYWQGASDAVREAAATGASKFDMAASGVSLFFKAVRVVTGHNMSPRLIYWHFKSLGVEGITHFYYLLGKANQHFKGSIILLLGNGQLSDTHIKREKRPVKQ
jgi:glycosyltransferase involved in cell wall biosynthesis